MKKLLLLFFFALQHTFSIGQVDTATQKQTGKMSMPKDTSNRGVELLIDTVEVYNIVEQFPEFPEGNQAMYKFIHDNLVYPTQDCVKGKVYLKFLVNKEGNISNIEVLRGIKGYPEFEREAIRVVKKMPPWIPGKQNGKAVSVWFTLPISFSLDK